MVRLVDMNDVIRDEEGEGISDEEYGKKRRKRKWVREEGNLRRKEKKKGKGKGEFSEIRVDVGLGGEREMGGVEIRAACTQLRTHEV